MLAKRMPKSYLMVMRLADELVLIVHKGLIGLKTYRLCRLTCPLAGLSPPDLLQKHRLRNLIRSFLHLALR